MGPAHPLEIQPLLNTSTPCALGLTCASEAAALASGSNSANSSAMGRPSSFWIASSTSGKGRGSTLSWSTSSVLHAQIEEPVQATCLRP